jgi:hypothetical protein
MRCAQIAKSGAKLGFHRRKNKKSLELSLQKQSSPLEPQREGLTQG